MITRIKHVYKKNCFPVIQFDKMSTDRENGRGNKIRARLRRGSRNPKHGKRKQ
jgi:hypothetical protein